MCDTFKHYIERTFRFDAKVGRWVIDQKMVEDHVKKNYVDVYRSQAAGKAAQSQYAYREGNSEKLIDGWNK